MGTFLKSEMAKSLAVLLVLVCLCVDTQTSMAQGHPSTDPAGMSQSQTDDRESVLNPSAEAELQKGTALTRQGAFVEAIPHLLASRGRVANNYAANFNLALCYVATRQSQRAIPLLTDLRASGHDNVDVNNLLAQAYVDESNNERALDALRRAAAFNPANEKLYIFVADACTAKANYALGLQVADLGLTHLPNSARLHFERAMFLSSLDQFDNAKNDFELARSLAPDSDIAFIAASQEAMFEGNIANAVRAARDGISKGHENFMLLTLLGEALLRSGVAPGQPGFDEARRALEMSVSQRADYASSQLTLGKLYLMEGRLNDAITHLEAARQLNPGNTAIYSNLATAYRKQGNLQKAQDVLSMLSKLNLVQAEKIRDAPGDRKASYAGTPRENDP
jgi:tetratricopeptide (TPR) repeat protein